MTVRLYECHFIPVNWGLSLPKSKINMCIYNPIMVCYIGLETEFERNRVRAGLTQTN
jgi:hypothetical protein